MPNRRSRCIAPAMLLSLAGALPLRAQQPLTLSQAIALAQQQGLQARAAHAALEAARHRRGAFTASLLPRLSLAGTVPAYNRSIIPVLQPDGTTQFRAQQQTSTELDLTLSQQLPLTGGSLFISSTLSRYRLSGQQTLDTWSSTPILVGLRQDILRPNTTAWNRRESGLEVELAERQFQEAMEDVALQTTTAFFDMYAAQVELANATTNAAVNDTLYTLNTGRYQVGKIGENDLLQSELVLLKARNAREAAQLKLDQTTDALRLALNVPADAPLQIAVTTAVPDIEADTTRAVAEAMRNRSSVIDAQLQDVRARREVTVARLANGVGATVQASYGYNATASESRFVYRDLLEARQFSLSVQVPLWQWGAHTEGVRAAKADREQTTRLTEAALRQVAHDAHFAALQLTQARRTEALSAKADTVAGKRYEVAYNRYVIGRISIGDLYIAQTEKDQALTQFVQALRAYWSAYYGLRRATLYDFEADRPIIGD
jgi:outer membrane protein TolC